MCWKCSCHFRGALWAGGAGKEPSVFWGPMGNDPELRHPGQWHLNVQVGMRKANFSSFIQQVFIEDQLFARRGSGFWGLVLCVFLGKHTENSACMWPVSSWGN